MFSFSSIVKFVKQGYTGRGIRETLRWAGLVPPANVTDMYLSGEHPAYIAQAAFVLTCGAGE